MPELPIALPRHQSRSRTGNERSGAELQILRRAASEPRRQARAQIFPVAEGGSSASPRLAGFLGSDDSGRSCRPVAHWRALRESNPCFRRERAASWTARRRAQPTRQRRCGKGATYKGLCRGGQATPRPRYRAPPRAYRCRVALTAAGLGRRSPRVNFLPRGPTRAEQPQIACWPRASLPPQARTPSRSAIPSSTVVALLSR